MSDEDPRPGLQTAPFSLCAHMALPERLLVEIELSVPLAVGTLILRAVPVLTPSDKPAALPEALPPEHRYTGGQGFSCSFWGDTSIQPTT